MVYISLWEIETNIGRVNNSDVQRPGTGPKIGTGSAFAGHNARLLSKCTACQGWPNAKVIYCRARAGLLTVAWIHAELAKHRALAVVVAGPALVKFSHLQSICYVGVSASVKSPKN